MEYILSKFSHRLAKDNSIAWLNAIRLRPVYLSGTSGEEVDRALQNNAIDTIDRDVAIKLVDNKIIVPQGTDEIVINRLKNKIESNEIGLMYLIVTDRCNLNCKYCFVKNSKDRDYIDSDMTFTIAKKAIDLYAEVVSKREAFERTIVFYGGEPLLNFNLIEASLNYIELCKKNGKIPFDTKLSLITNGICLSESIVTVLKKYNVTVGISIDGGVEETDFNRGNGTALCAREAIMLLKEKGVSFGASVTIANQSYSDSYALINDIISLEIPSLGFNILFGGEKQGITDDYIEFASETLILAFKRFRELGIYEDRVFRKVKAFVEGKPILYDCGAEGGNQITIAPDGRIGICHAMLGSGKYFNVSLKNNDFSIKSDDFCEWRLRSPFYMEECQKCRAIGICGGGCAYSAMISSGSIWELDSRYCVIIKKIFDWIVWDLYNKSFS